MSIFDTNIDVYYIRRKSDGVENVERFGQGEKCGGEYEMGGWFGSHNQI